MFQAWPLPPAYGATLGYILGALGAVVVSAVQSPVNQAADEVKII